MKSSVGSKIQTRLKTKSLINNEIPFQMNRQNCRRTENEQLLGRIAVNRLRLFRLLILLVILSFFFVRIFCVSFGSQLRRRQLRTPIAGPLVRAGQKFRRRELRQRGVDGTLAGPAVVARRYRRQRSSNPFLTKPDNLSFSIKLLTFQNK